MEGKFTVRMSQDPRFIINKDHAENVVKMKAVEELGEYALTKATWKQNTNPVSSMLETEVEVYIFSVDEMRSTKRYIETLEQENTVLKRSLRGGKI